MLETMANRDTGLVPSIEEAYQVPQAADGSRRDNERVADRDVAIRKVRATFPTQEQAADRADYFEWLEGESPA